MWWAVGLVIYLILLFGAIQFLRAASEAENRSILLKNTPKDVPSRASNLPDEVHEKKTRYRGAGGKR
jgi:hypothetical protein